MITRTELLAYVDALLATSRFQDYCPNGLQVEGKQQINTIVTGVTASQALLDAAVANEADAILVHHGYFWRGEAAPVIGVKYQRLKTLLEHDINLLAYHLPLDAHTEFGNNVQLAKLLDIEIDGRISGTGDPAIGLCGCLKSPMPLDEFADYIDSKLDRKPMVVAGHDRVINTIGWCTGAAQGYIQQAAELGLDAFISGEASEQTTHLARELGIHYISAGHHATERYGVKALGEHLAAQFGLQHIFIDIDNPV
ncbi:Nif3-like dinuclear metal center hexameric protein [Methylophaga pinxianii]|uniref:Nif3-like dinuclear metal center hexameric protein n=1 Tax=Methylophaga pinxianii TaxID=2881052 RepID=UPI001CF55CCF|nr:Nif3-like dinuclear metal center hexameric protein [Methylophaga pinxianii]MCB2427763.1 Nif3-like dinuclear metal center hexameric protein [Methylophaga pinxianii]UPH45630.1 Nif3-like dinuclear metal center hexameric protein [Methylophaga pinxianii]